MMNQQTVAFSVLDLASRKDIDQGPAPALERSLALAQHVERLGFTRFWVAEADELIFTCDLYEHEDRLRSFDLLAGLSPLLNG